MTTTPPKPSFGPAPPLPVMAMVAAVAALSFALAGCGGVSATTTPTIELVTTSTPITTAPTAEVAPASATESTTDSRPTDNQEQTTEAAVARHIDEIEAAVTASRQVQVEVLTNPSAPVERMEGVVTGRALEATVEHVLKARAEGQTFAGEFVGVPVETQLLSDTAATHLECGIDALASFTADGELIVPADEAAHLRRYDLSLIDGRWLVELVSFEGSERTQCEL